MHGSPHGPRQAGADEAKAEVQVNALQRRQAGLRQEAGPRQAGVQVRHGAGREGRAGEDHRRQGEGEPAVAGVDREDQGLAVDGVHRGEDPVVARQVANVFDAALSVAVMTANSNFQEQAKLSVVPAEKALALFCSLLGGFFSLSFSPRKLLPSMLRNRVLTQRK